APAITPVPAPAGFSSTRAAPNSPITVWGMVPPTMGTSTKDFLALWMALRMASGISGALPWAAPTRPLRSPTTTRAVKLNRRPPLTTLATRLMVTTRSSNSLSSVSRRLANPRLTSFGSELQAGFPGAFGQSLHPAVIEVTAPVETDLLDALGNCPFRQQAAHLTGGLFVARGFQLVPQFRVQGRSRGQSCARIIPYELGVNTLMAAEHAQAGPLG